ncbi:MAG TPA: tetratricopeptide repeat protein [Candidatus Dormibacteraeota bacterium]|nr:tetratricopeptide repeat protein [Candidatus Dormibacteraeota bacterium]
MGDHRRILVVLALSAWAAAETSASKDVASYVSTTDSVVLQTSSQEPAGTSSSNPKHKPTHHTTVAEEVDPSPELAKAEEFIQKQNFSEAEPLLKQAVDSDPANYVAWFELGFVESGLGKIDESIAAYRKSVAAKPDVFESNLNLGLQLAKSGQADAEQFLRAATHLKPMSHVAEGQSRAWVSLAHVIEAARPDEAIAAYRQAARLQPKDVEPHLAAGLLLEKQNKFADAEQEYKEALALDPSSSDAVTGLANIYMRGRRFPEAAAELRKVVATHPEQAAAHVQLGRVLAAEGMNEDAVHELEAGAKLAPTDVSVQRDLADLYSTMGKNEQAEAAYRGLVAGHANEPELHRGLGVSLLRQKKFADAQQEFLTTVKLNPDLADAYVDLAFAASENKNYELTIRSLDERAKFRAEMPPICFFLRATAYDHLRDVKQATANYRLFLQAAGGKYPDQEWQATHRLIALEPKK